MTKLIKLIGLNVVIGGLFVGCSMGIDDSKIKNILVSTKWEKCKNVATIEDVTYNNPLDYAIGSSSYYDAPEFYFLKDGIFIPKNKTFYESQNFDILNDNQFIRNTLCISEYRSDRDFSNALNELVKVREEMENQKLKPNWKIEQNEQMNNNVIEYIKVLKKYDFTINEKFKNPKFHRAIVIKKSFIDKNKPNILDVNDTKRVINLINEYCDNYTFEDWKRGDY